MTVTICRSVAVQATVSPLASCNRFPACSQPRDLSVDSAKVKYNGMDSNIPARGIPDDQQNEADHRSMLGEDAMHDAKLLYSVRGVCAE